LSFVFAPDAIYISLKPKHVAWKCTRIPAALITTD
jgi:hypothetical protein